MAHAKTRHQTHQPKLLHSEPTKARRRILFVINPIAGGEDKADFIKLLKELALKRQFAYHILMTNGQNDEDRILELLAHYEPDTVVAVGGDGTCNLVGKLLVGKDLKLGLIPFGSANGMAKELKLPDSPKQAVEVILKDKVRTIDTILINQHHQCLRISDIGINARIVRRFEKSKRRGMLGYARHFFDELYNSRAKRITLQIDGRTLLKKVHMVAVANASRYGTGAAINPTGQLDDGRFEICLIKNISVRSFFALLWAFFTGRKSNPIHMEIYDAKHVIISMKKPRVMQIDGELIGKVQTLEARIQPACLQLLVPGE